MLGKASEIRTIQCESYCEIIDGKSECYGVDFVINRTLKGLSDVNADIISIQYQQSQNENLADSALIIYKEASQ